MSLWHRTPALVAVIAGALSIAGAIAQWRAVTVAVPFADHLRRSSGFSFEEWLIRPFGVNHPWLWLAVALVAVLGSLVVARRQAVILLCAAAAALGFLLWTADSGATMAFVSQDEASLSSLMWTLDGAVAGALLAVGGVIGALVEARR